jgi:hypothetical protein
MKELNDSAAYLNGHDAVVVFEQPQAAAMPPRNQRPSRPYKELYDSSSPVIADWGTNNQFPSTIRKELEKNPDLAAGLDWKARALYAGGLKYEVLEGGQFVEKRIPEVEKFLKRNRRYPVQAVNHFYRLYNVFPELVLTKDRSEIYYLTAQNPEYCRYELANKRTGLVRKCYINANWENTASHNDSLTIPVDVIDPILETELSIRQGSRYKYIYPLSYPTGRKYYQLAHWNSIRQSGWLELANSIPEFKKALMKNQISVKYIIHVPDYWWEWKFPEWKNYDANTRQEKQRDELKKFNDFLTGAKNAGKSIMVTFQTDKHTKKEYAGWRLEPVDNKIKDGVYIEDSVEATIKIFSALGVDPALAGIIPGKGGSNRSGSDKREAFNAYISLCKIHADIVLEPYDIVSEYNGWNDRFGMMRWSFRQPIMQTLDKVPESQRTTQIEGGDMDP